MALINCAECGTQISDRASACVKCGAPTSAAAEKGSVAGVVTTQQTAKKYKGMQLAGMGGITLGVVLIIGGNAAPWGSVLCALGLFTYLIARFMAWWRHG